MGSRLSVLMMTWEYPPRIVGGIANHVDDLSAALSSLGVDVHVATCDFPDARSFEEIGGVKVYRIDSYRFPTSDFATWVFMMNVNMINQTAEWVGSGKINVDLIHAHDWLVATSSLGLKHMFRCPLIATIHSTEYGRRNGLHSDNHRMIHETESRLSYEAWRKICCSQYMASHVSWAFDIRKEDIDVIHNGVDLHKFEEPFDRDKFRSRFASPDEKIILFVGRLVYEKGAHILIEAFRRVLGKINAKLVIVGDGYMKDQLLSQAYHSGISNKVYVAGFLDNQTLRFLYRTADVCVVPSLYEPFGIVCLEAMAAQTPIVVADTGGLAEIVQHDKDGVKVYVNNAESLAWGITRILTDPGYAESLKKNAFQKILDIYNWKSIAARTLSVYKRVLNEYQKGNWKPR